MEHEDSAWSDDGARASRPDAAVLSEVSRILLVFTCVASVIAARSMAGVTGTARGFFVDLLGSTDALPFPTKVALSGALHWMLLLLMIVGVAKEFVLKNKRLCAIINGAHLFVVCLATLFWAPSVFLPLTTISGEMAR